MDAPIFKGIESCQSGDAYYYLRRASVMKITTVGIDLTKNPFGCTM